MPISRGLCVSHLNDLVVDDRGYALMRASSGLIRSLTNHLRRLVSCVLSLMVIISSRPTTSCFPNGSVITEDGSTLIVGESLGGRYTAFDIGEDGSLSNRRPWAVLCDPR